MAISPARPLGPFWDDEGQLTPGGVVQFLDPSTDVPKTIYTDLDQIISATNPVVIGSDGKFSVQIYLGVGGYKVRHYSLIDDSIVSPVFPDDYNLINEWYDEGTTSPSSGASDYTTVGTINELIALDPTVGVAQVLGYYNADDDIDTRTYYWDATSAVGADGGAYVSSSVSGSGRWILKRTSPVLDVRWWGAIPNSGRDCNPGISSALAYAAGSTVAPRTVYFPAGDYIVVTGSITASSNVRVEMSNRVLFYNRLSGDFCLYINGFFDLRLSQPLQHPSSVGKVYLSFYNNVIAKGEDLFVNANWYFDGVNDCLPKLGTAPLYINNEFTINGLITSYTVSKVRFGPSGKLTHNIDTLVTYQEIDAPSTQLNILAGGNGVYPMIAVNRGTKLYTAWVGRDTLRFMNKTGADIIVNSTINISTGMTLGLATAGRVSSSGAYIQATGGYVTLPENLVGKVISVESDSGTVTCSGNYNSDNFVISNATSVRGFIRVATEGAAGVCRFNGENILDIDVSGLGGIEIQDVICTGEFKTNTSSTIQSVTLVDSRLSGTVNAAFGNLALKNCVYTATSSVFNDISIDSTVFAVSTLPSFNDVIITNNSLVSCTAISATLDANYIKATNSTFQIGPGGAGGIGDIGYIQALKVDIRKCTLNDCFVVGTMTASNPVKIFFDDNTCIGTYVGPQGTAGGVDYIYIRRNYFEIVPAWQTLYAPILQNGFTPTSLTILTGIEIADNTPSVNEVDPEPSQNNIGTGTRVAQTKFTTRVAFPVATSLNSTRYLILDNTKQNFIWAPDGLYATDGSYVMNKSAMIPEVWDNSLTGTEFIEAFVGGSINEYGSEGAVIWLFATGGGYGVAGADSIFTVDIDFFKH